MLATIEETYRDAGNPRPLRVANGSDLVSWSLYLSRLVRGVRRLNFRGPAEPTDDACIEAHKSGLRNECVNTY